MKKLLVMQWHGFTALWLWIRGRRQGSGTLIGYARDQLPMIFVLTGIFAVETVVVGMLIPSWWIHILDVIALLQVLGIGALMVTWPHYLTEETLVLREGSTYEVRVPLGIISSARVHRKDHSGKTIELDDDMLSIVIGNQTDIVLVLSEPIAVPGGEVTTIRFRADEPRDAVKSINDALSKLTADVQ
ncbi:hypothetical protein LWC34_01730 [Kibdelosporangium philippinense]|uniref:DUF304 domain-containing protein n=1 Tax=Kibdelosporangium philippinense TaxID=211113 RepID=A0ABS8Z2J5_9PSEU|nr:hypothetical protein [Kibdelosporangium philippinense]MCE7001567.1 hypothetical protein [Kibdelosporangium philippinense]